MKKVEAKTLEEAYAKASKMLECSISELQYEVLQYPSNGIFGLLKKSAIIVASCSNKVKSKTNKIEDTPPKDEVSVATKIVAIAKEEESVEEVDIVETTVSSIDVKEKMLCLIVF